MEVGDRYKTSCPVYGCNGFVEGTFGGVFYVGERRIEYTQVLKAKCNTCNSLSLEVFEVWDEDRDDFYVSRSIILPINDDSDIEIPGLGVQATNITPEMEEFLATGFQKK